MFLKMSRFAISLGQAHASAGYRNDGDGIETQLYTSARFTT
jgi:hypothetical protein